MNVFAKARTAGRMSAVLAATSGAAVAAVLLGPTPVASAATAGTSDLPVHVVEQAGAANAFLTASPSIGEYAPTAFTFTIPDLKVSPSPLDPELQKANLVYELQGRSDAGTAWTVVNRKDISVSLSRLLQDAATGTSAPVATDKVVQSQLFKGVDYKTSMQFRVVVTVTWTDAGSGGELGSVELAPTVSGDAKCLADTVRCRVSDGADPVIELAPPVA